MIVGDGVFEISGTEGQVAILAGCFDPGAEDYIAFPWREMTARPASMIPIGWADLNAEPQARALRAELEVLDEISDGDRRLAPLDIPGHVHIDGDNANQGHGILRQREGRWFVAGVFWTSGRIEIDVRCEQEPELAREVMSAELAHTVDYFLPLSDQQKAGITDELHAGSGPDEHTWWERHDYGEEYYTLVGEAFMAAFTIAYAPGIEPWQDAFTHKVRQEQAEAIRRLVGIRATTTPTEPEPPTEEVPPELPGPPEPPTLPTPGTRPGCLPYAGAAVAGTAGVVIGYLLGG